MLFRVFRGLNKMVEVRINPDSLTAKYSLKNQYWFCRTFFPLFGQKAGAKAKEQPSLFVFQSEFKMIKCIKELAYG